MSRQLPDDRRWTDEEVEYAISRGRANKVKLNQEQFPATTEKPLSVDDSPKLKLDQDIFDFVNGLDLDRLKSEIQKRELVPKGDEKGLKVQLAQVLQSERDTTSGNADA